MITGRQIRAARSLLGWSADDLARKCGLTRSTITKLEGDNASPQEKTLNSILGMFDKHGIEFTDGEGVRFRKNEMRVFSGKDGYRQCLDHIYKVMKDKGGRTCQIASDGKYLAYADDYAELHMERMAKLPNIEARVLTAEGDDSFPADYCSYRWLPAKYAALAPFYVYNDHVLLPIQETNHQMELVSIHSKLLAKRYFDQFEMFWAEAVAPKKKGRFRL